MQWTLIARPWLAAMWTHIGPTANASVCCRQDDLQEVMQVLRMCHGADVNNMRAGVC